jgi:hypothetical protein
MKMKDSELCTSANVQINKTNAIPIIATSSNLAALQPNPITSNNYVLPDTGANGTFIQHGSNATTLAHRIVPTDPRTAIQLTLPNGAQLKSSATGILNTPPGIPTLTAHLFNGLASAPLMGIGALCDHNLTATFRNDSVVISDQQGTPLWTGPRDNLTGMWKLPIEQYTQANSAYTPSTSNDLSTLAFAFEGALHYPWIANNVIRNTTNAQRVAFFHACMCSPAVSSFLLALDIDSDLFPGITAQMVRDNPPNPVATPMGHLDQSRQGMNSTKQNSTTVTQQTSNSTDEPEDDACPTTIAEPTRTVYSKRFELTGRHYSDATGKFPIRSFSGNEYLILFYCQDTNFIHLEPVSSRSSSDRVKAYALGEAVFQREGFKPKFEFLDNEISKGLETFFAAQNIEYEHPPSSTHRRNKAERCMRTAKNHFEAMLATCDREMPLAAWDELIDHAVLTMNLMRRSNTMPHLSAQVHLKGRYSYNHTPIGPPGCKVVVLEPAATRPSWAPHGIIGFYVGPCPHHHRTYKVFIPATQSVRRSDSLSWHPANVIMPGASVLEQLTAAINALRKALDHVSSHPPALHDQHQPHNALQPTLADALTQLSSIFAPVTTAPINSATDQSTQLQRVAPSNTLAAPTSIAQRVPPIVEPREEHAAGGDNLTYYDLFPEHRPRKKKAVPTEESEATPALPPTSTLVNPPVQPPSSSIKPCTQPSNAPAPVTVSSRPKRSATRPPGFWQSHHSTASPVTETAETATTTTTAPSTLESLEYHANKATYSPEGEELRHDKLMKGPHAEIWDQLTADEYDRLIERTGTMSFIDWSKKPSNRPASNMVLACTDKLKVGLGRKRRVRATHGGRTDYSGDLSAYTASLASAKILFNSIISTHDAKFASIDIVDFYLNTPLDRPEFVIIRRNQIPNSTWTKYNLNNFVHNNCVMARLDKTIPGLPQSGILAQQALVAHLGQHGYTFHAGCEITHATRKTQATLVVDDFGIKYINEDDLTHLIDTLQLKYAITIDRTGSQYIGLTLDWTYDGPDRKVQLSMPHVIPKLLACLGVEKLLHATNNPTEYERPIYGSKIQLAEEEDKSPLLPPERTTRVQSIIGSLSYYATAVDSTMLAPTRMLSLDQAHPTEETERAADHLLQYAATWPSAIVTFHPSDMILKVITDATYLSERHARSRAAGLHHLGDSDNKEQWCNGAISVMSKQINVVTSSAFESEIGGAWLNAVASLPETRTLEIFGHKQPPTEIISDNKVAVAIANGTAKQRLSKPIDMRFNWLIDRTLQKQFKVVWRAGVNNLADYFTKKHSTKHHKEMRHFFVSDPPLPTANTARTRRNHRKQQ